MSVDERERMPANILEQARSLNRWSLSQSEVRKLVNQLRGGRYLPEARIAFAGNVVLEPLPDYVLAHLACDGILASSYSVPFGQLMRELLEPDSGLRKFDPTFLHLHFEVESLLQGQRDRRAFETAEHRRAALEEIVEFTASTISAALKCTEATILLSNFVAPRSYTLGLADFRSDYGEHEFFAELNLALARSVRTNLRVQIVDLATLTAHFGLSNVRDRRLYYMSKMPWYESFFSPLADQLARHVKVSLGHVRKCLVVDFDNTLWDGVLGEDGPLGVRVGIGDPLGEAHLELQQRILALKQRGILLAACSKNNLEDVEELFRLRSDMPLRISDFACMEIGWGSKHEGLSRIAFDLNIGTDSLVFLDDNPVEIALIEDLMPEVECILLPRNSSLRATCLDALHSLDRAAITAEDIAKDRQYADVNARKNSRGDFADLRDYLHSLRTSIVIRPASHDLLQRAHQLFTKTNQFNVTGRRYTLAELERVVSDSKSHLFMVHAQDRFGDLGWVCAVLLRANEPSSYHIENVVLSCRALGRGIEILVLNHIRHIAFDHEGCSILTADYRPNKKNAQVCTFFESQGFESTRIEPDDSKHYVLLRETPCSSSCDWIAVKIEDPARIIPPKSVS